MDGEKSLYEKEAELVTSEEGKDISVADQVILEFVIHRGAKSRVWTHVDFKQITNQYKNMEKNIHIRVECHS